MKALKRSLLVAASLAALSSTTSLAAGATDWTGFYAGIGLAVQKSNADVESTSTTVTSTTNLQPNVTGNSEFELLDSPDEAALSFPPSLIAGFGTQLDGNFYVGLEGDLDLSGGVVIEPGYTTDCSTIDLCILGHTQGTLDTLGRLRAIAGVVATPDLMIFGSAGVALAQGSFGITSTAYLNNVVVDPDSDYTPTQLLFGATVGGGVEIKATDNLRVRLEGAVDLYPTAVNYSGLSVTSTVDDGASSNKTLSGDTTGSVKFANMMVRGALLWQF
jgi:outer membrane immunogenic protein